MSTRDSLRDADARQAGSLRLAAGILAGRASASLIRAARAGGATTVPGRVARFLVPDLLPRLAARLRHGVILVTGTNGKTTTARLVSALLAAAGHRPIHNRAGANLPAGIAAALVGGAGVDGRLQGDVGVFEVDEAALPGVAEALRPRAVVLGNLFRDQLDRYGEVDLVAARWRRALDALGGATTVLYNADDPLVADVARGRTPSRTFGVDDPDLRPGAVLEHAADARYCYRCGVPYVYRTVTLGHLGDYRCPRCGVARPALEAAARAVRLAWVEGSSFTLASGGMALALRTVLPGLYNVYNITAAVATALWAGVPPEVVAPTVAAFAPAFGRGERLHLDGHPVHLLLAKNPAGFNEVLRTVLADARPLVAVIAINDLLADGQDISWLWDVDFELLREAARLVVATGRRREDLAVRLKYAGLAPGTVVVEADEGRALARGLAALDPGQPLYVIPTYTALLRLRGLLTRRGLVRGFWEA